jgi:hypothetical protein
MRIDTLTALLLDPFLTFEEAVKQFGAMSEATRGGRATADGTTAPRHLPGVARRPARIGVSGVPVVHHPPATAG